MHLAMYPPPLRKPHSVNYATNDSIRRLDIYARSLAVLKEGLSLALRWLKVI
jgi:hypothetical protein